MEPPYWCTSVVQRGLAGRWVGGLVGWSVNICRYLSFVCVGCQVRADPEVHGDPVHSRRSPDASCHLFCYVCAGKEVSV